MLKSVKYTPNGMEIKMVTGNNVTFLLNDIQRECIRAKINEESLALLQIKWDSERGWDGACERWVGPKNDIDRIIRFIIGREIRFGEIAGKHSDICSVIEKCDITVIDDKDKLVAHLLHHPTGHDYDHSFLNVFYEQGSDESGDLYEDITVEQWEEFGKLIRH